MSYSIHRYVDGIPKDAIFDRVCHLVVCNDIVSYSLFVSKSSKFLYCVFDNGCIVRTKLICPCVLANRYIGYGYC